MFGIKKKDAKNENIIDETIADKSKFVTVGFGVLAVSILMFFVIEIFTSAKISNQNFSEKADDGLKLKSTYITNIIKCVPPGDKPLNSELKKCSNYFVEELHNLKNLKVIVTLGKVAFDTPPAIDLASPPPVKAMT